MYVVSELTIEKSLEPRDTYLSILKQMDFQIAMDLDVDLEKSEKLESATIEQITKNRTRNCLSKFKIKFSMSLSNPYIH